jgi:hypothetical protein
MSCRPARLLLTTHRARAGRYRLRILAACRPSSGATAGVVVGGAGDSGSVPRGIRACSAQMTGSAGMRTLWTKLAELSLSATLILGATLPSQLDCHLGKLPLPLPLPPFRHFERVYVLTPPRGAGTTSTHMTATRGQHRTRRYLGYGERRPREHFLCALSSL